MMETVDYSDHLTSMLVNSVAVSMCDRTFLTVTSSYYLHQEDYVLPGVGLSVRFSGSNFVQKLPTGSR